MRAQFHPRAVRLVERNAGALGRIHDCVDCWACLDRGGLAGGDLRFHLREQERAIGVARVERRHLRGRERESLVFEASLLSPASRGGEGGPGESGEKIMRQ